MMHPAPSPAWSGESQSGFTLIEVLAALSLASLILVSLSLATTSVRQGVEKVRESLSNQAAVSAAAGIFVRDVWRIAKIRRGGEASLGRYVFEGSSRQVIYPLSEDRAGSHGGLHLVRLRAMDADGGMRLVRDRIPFPAGEAPGADIAWTDSVVLLEGSFDIAFAFRAQRTGDRSWSESWSATGAMPEQVRLTIADRATGRLRIPVLVQSLQIDAEVECVADPSECGDPQPEGGMQ